MTTKLNEYQRGLLEEVARVTPKPKAVPHVVSAAPMANPAPSANGNVAQEATTIKPNGRDHETSKQLEQGVTLDDFVAYMPGHSYMCTLTREMWPAASVNARIPPVLVVDEDNRPVLSDEGKRQYVGASAWLDKNRAVEQMTWAPGEAMLIQGRLVLNGGWIEREGVTCFNLYRSAIVLPGKPQKAVRWMRHLVKIYGKEAARHIIKYFAFKVQRPEVKINHALLLGGGQGIGKDTICAPLKYAVGQWNFIEVSPKHINGRFNSYAKSVVLRVSEARDLGDGNRFDFYEQMEVLTASPPEVLRVDEKHLREYDVFNVCGVVITTNYKTNGIYLPADDRRHFVAWSTVPKEAFSETYWAEMWTWYEAGGFGHVAAYLRTLDIADFNPKAPPPKTEAFWEIVNANRAPEDAELADGNRPAGRARSRHHRHDRIKGRRRHRPLDQGPKEPPCYPPPPRKLRL